MSELSTEEYIKLLERQYDRDKATIKSLRVDVDYFRDVVLRCSKLAKEREEKIKSLETELKQRRDQDKQ